MDKPVSNLSFNMMAFCFLIRDFFSPPRKILAEVGIEPGHHVLDYGCGPGSYTIAAAELVGESGRVYAVDIHPVALQKVKRAASRKKLRNIETILTDGPIDLSDTCIDVALLYDTYHELGDPGGVTKELHRVLKQGAVLSFSDHHMKDDEIAPAIEASGMFKLSKRAEKSFLFSKV